MAWTHRLGRYGSQFRTLCQIVNRPLAEVTHGVVDQRKKIHITLPWKAIFAFSREHGSLNSTYGFRATCWRESLFR